MFPFIIIGLVALLVLLFPYLLQKYRSARRKKIMSEPFPVIWISILESNISLYSKLPPEIQKTLHQYILVFLAEKKFEGCGGQDVSDEMRVTIAAQACLLLVNNPNPTFYPRLKTILVYPSAYKAKRNDGFGKIVTEEIARLGESWTRGDLVLAWDHAKHGAVEHMDGHNVVYHEFAHQLDQEDGEADGAPILKPGGYAIWVKVFQREYKKLLLALQHNLDHVIDEYGSVNPAEFFAVVTELFFERPWALKNKHPELYRVLEDYYGCDPVEWFD
ncbi:zinc-dependent peptidase [candidate division KSB1 bacterium]|nr:zinc-dependent peptidase [candidate division KSB1 bacterium]